ncbi:translocation protein sec66 [Lactarius pseudohatsudake]|nr:translocation protein sec66 [Lactarius pseudohatsudake]
MASVLVPVFYVLIVFGGLFLFGRFYRKSTANKRIDPYFPRHHERDTYVTLLQRTDPPASDALLKAALDVQRILRLREDKQALQNLLQKGSVGDDLWNSLLAAEKELEAEIVEVHAEANSFVEGWGHVLFQTASEMLANEKTRVVVEQIPLERARNEAKFGKGLPGTTQAPPVPASASSGPTTPKSSTATNESEASPRNRVSVRIRH